MPNTKVVFLGSKPIGNRCFRFLIDQQSTLNIEMVALLTQASRNTTQQNELPETARLAGIPLLEHPDEIPETDWLISVQYHQILKQHHLVRAKKSAVNLHMAPLPEYRGCNQFSQAIIDGCTEFGTSLHIMDTRIDHGDLLAEKRFPIPDSCWVNDLYHLTEEASYTLFCEQIPLLFQGLLQPVSQQALLADRGSSLHFRDEIHHLKEIDLQWPAEKIERHIRATSMPGFEPPYCIVDGKKVYFQAQWPKPE